jgi:two-component sensor histidine kinase
VKDGGPDLDDGVMAWSVAPDGAWLAAGPQWSAHTGLNQQQSEGFGWLQAVHADDRELARACWTQAQERGKFACDSRIYNSRRDQYTWRRTRAFRKRIDEAGNSEWAASSVDIDDLHTARDELAAALAESRRRSRNTLGIVRSIARRTAETSESVESYAMHFEGRLDALARVGSLVAGSHNSGVPLDALIAEELFSFKAREDSALQISGAPIRVKPGAADMLGLAIHELATNAMKFGALSPTGGKLEIAWRLLGREPDVLLLTWSESSVAPRSDPQKPNGFGADLLQRGLAYALNARTEITLQADGLTCAIELPAAIFIA